MERTKRLENIPGLGETSWAVIKKFTWGESADVKNKALKFKINAQKQEGTIDILEAQMAELIHGVKEASFIPPGSSEEQRRRIFLEALMRTRVLFCSKPSCAKPSAAVQAS